MQEMDEKFRRLIESYLPFWQVDPGSGEPEAALLYAGWQLLEDTRRRMDCLPQKHEREFLNAWADAPKQPEPMQTYAMLHAPEGERIPAGSEVYLSGNGTRLWKTVHSVTAQSIHLEQQILESARLGKLIDISLPSEEVPSRIFDYRHRGTQRNAVRFAHPDAFRSECGGKIALLLPECAEALMEILTDADRVRWTLECGSGPEIPLELPEKSDRKLLLTLPRATDAAALTVSFEPGNPVPTEIFGHVRVQVLRPMQRCTAILTDEETIQTGTFEPFGPSPELWRCCYLAAPDVLSLRGAEVQTEFLLSLNRKEETLPVPEQKPKYHSIMLRMPPPPPEPAELRAEHVVWEYWNGSAWLPVPGTVRESGLFAAGEESHRVSVRFVWPKDAAPCEVQGQEAVWLRWRITRADGMGILPRRTFSPQVQDVRMQSLLRESPVVVSVRIGLEKTWIPLEQSRTARLFPHPVSEEDGWWLCFDRAPKGSSVQFYLELAGRTEGGSLTVWESTRTGLAACSVTDGTDGLSHSGMLGLADLQGVMTEQFGKTGWWICLRNRENSFRSRGIYARMTALYSGAVLLEAENTDRCEKTETVRPLRGGAVSGQTLTRSFGGTGEETDGEQLLRAEKARHHLDRAVSALDVEQLVQSEIRDVVRTRCRRKNSTMEIAVLMRDIHQHSAAFARRKEEITCLLEQKSVLPAVGLEIRVREPDFYPVQTAVWLRGDPDVDFQADRELVRQTVERFLNPVTGKFRGDGWHLGDLPTQQELSNALMMQLPQLRLVKVLLTVITPQGREVEIDRIRDPFALPVVGQTVVREVWGEEIG